MAPSKTQETQNPPWSATEAPAGEQQLSLVSRSLMGTLGVLLSRLSGIARSVVLSAGFGAGLALDAFFVALRLPSSLRDLLADGALSSAATTVLSGLVPDPQAFRRALAQVLVAFLIVTVAMAMLGALATRPIVELLVDKSYPEEGVALAAEAFQIMAFYLPLAMWSALCMAVLSVRGALLRATVASSFFNLGIMGGASVLVPVFSRFGWSSSLALVWGTMVGGVFQCVYLSYPLVRSRDLTVSDLVASVRQAPFWRSAEVGQVARLILPRTVGQGAVVLGMMASTFYATSLGPGYLTYVTNALIIVLVPVGLFGVAGGYAALPLLSRARAEGRYRDFWSLFDESLWLVTFLAAASVSALVFLAEPLLVLIFEHGSFKRSDVIANAGAVIAMAGTIVFSSQSRIQTQALFALGRTGFVALNSFFYLGVLVASYRVAVEPFGLLGLGAASVAAAGASWLAGAIVLRRLERRDAVSKAHLVSRPQALLLGLAFLSIFGGLYLRHLGWGSLAVDLSLSRVPAFGHLDALLSLLSRGAALAVFWAFLGLWLAPPSLRCRLSRFAAVVLRRGTRRLPERA